MIPSLDGPPKQVLTQEESDQLKVVLAELLLRGAGDNSYIVQAIKVAVETGFRGPGMVFMAEEVLRHIRAGQEPPEWTTKPYMHK